MQCTKPFKLGLSDDHFIMVPCNKCDACKKSRAREWSARMVHESNYWESSLFITLTYSDDCLPDLSKESGFVKKQLRDYFKRCRKELEFKYYACFEYGEQTARPHFHFILFSNIKTEDIQLWLPPGAKKMVPKTPDPFGRQWKYGTTHTGYMTIKSARYVAAYVDKKYSNALNDIIYGELQPPFSVQSKGIGLRYAMDHSEQISRNELTVCGEKLALPRYYAKKLDIPEEILLYYGDVNRIAERERVESKYEPDSERSFVASVESERRQKERHAKARKRLYGHDRDFNV